MSQSILPAPGPQAQVSGVPAVFGRDAVEGRLRSRLYLELLAVLLFLALAAYQLDMPGLHYDEAKEAGLNAMELVTWRPLTAFRDATIQVGPWRLPLMVQDYIGALNVLLAVPFLQIGGINVMALRALPLLTAALTLLLAMQVARRLGGSVAAGATALLLAVNPSFIFWSRQGIFVTNLTALIFVAALFSGLRWWQARRPRDLWLTAFLWGLGIYAKLSFVWVCGAMVGAALLAWALGRRGRIGWTDRAPAAIRNSQFAIRNSLIPLLCFLIPLAPLILFNLRTGGTLTAIFGNLGRSYYGVNNAAYLPNLLTRLGQVVTLLRGDHFWYLGGVFANAWAPWSAAALLLLGVSRRRGPAGRILLPLALLALIVAQSAFTVSDLFITHYVLLPPLIALAGGLALAAGVRQAPGATVDENVPQSAGLRQWRSERQSSGLPNRSSATVNENVMLSGMSQPRLRQDPSEGSRARGQDSSLGSRRNKLFAVNPLRVTIAAILLLALWAGGDLGTTLRYHRALTDTGGHSAHSDAITGLAEYLVRGGLSAPPVLDWGLDAPVRFLTAGRVTPVELFGYAALDAPDAGFAARVEAFLGNPDTVFVAHAPEATVFRGRVEALRALAAQRGLTLREEVRFDERSGRPLFVIYRAR